MKSIISSCYVSRLPRALALVAQAGVFVCLLACGRSENATAADVQANKYAPVEIRFSDPGNAGVMAYGKKHGSFEAELAKYNAKIAWIPAGGAFSANFDAMNSGAINASGAAVSPIVGALSHNLKFKIFAIGNPSSVRQAGVVVPRDSSVKSLQELVGKRVAVNWAAHGDYVLLKALTKAGVDPNSVTRVPIQPAEAAAAFATGKIDAWSTFGVFYSTAVRNGAKVLVTEEQIDSDDVSVNAANEAVLSKNPDAFLAFIEVIRELTELAHQEPEKFQNVFADKGPTALSGALLQDAIEDTRIAPVVRVPTVDDRDRVGRVAQLLFENKSIDRAIRADDLVFDLEAAAKSVSLSAKGQVH
jgi:sulfonate transport system substrate-binding protein